jgi:protein-L-isoaspartate(D-aspartate) O-methyltransferase
MIDFADLRTKMVDSQLRTEGVTDFDLLAALGEVPREDFVPARLKPLAYIDDDLLLTTPGTEARYLMRAAPFARLIQAAAIDGSATVLDVGAGTGYSAAVLGKLGRTVVALEPSGELAAVAAKNLAALGIDNASVVKAPLEQGHPEGAPYDVIVFEGAVGGVPEAFFGQLNEGGRLVAVVGYGRAAPAMIFTRTAAEIGSRPIFDAYVPALPGFAPERAFVF